VVGKGEGGRHLPRISTGGINTHHGLALIYTDFPGFLIYHEPLKLIPSVFTRT